MTTLRGASRQRWATVAAVAGVAMIASAGIWAVARSGDEPADAAAPGTSAGSASEEADAPCSARLRVRDSWEGGYSAEVEVTAGARGLSAWRVTLDLADAEVREAWGSSLASGATGSAAAANAEYNGVVEAGGRASFGFTAEGEVPSPAVACDGESAQAPAAGDEQDAVVAGEDEREPVPPAAADVQPPSNAPSGDDWLSVEGNRIVDDAGRPVWLTGANWFGFNTGERVLHGLWSVNLEETVAAIAGRGINVLRVPISTELLLEWRAGQARTTSSVNASANPGLADATTLEVFDAFLVAAQAHGLKVIVDVHSAHADNAGHIAPVWTSEEISLEEFMVAWEWLAARYAADDTIIGFDLENEPHGKPPEEPRATWGDGGPFDWREVASEAAQRIHAVHPDALLLVEGIEATPRPGADWTSQDPRDYDVTWWGGNLRLAGEDPVDGPEDKILYSPHDYGPLVYEQPWFQGPFTAASLERDVWGPSWLYLHDEGISPLLIGEWGGRLDQDERQDRWMAALRDLIADRRLHHTFWCINPNSGDTGGLLNGDWSTWDEAKYAMLEPVLWQDGDGRYVGLDHEVPLPGGVTVSSFYADGGAPPVG